MGYLSQKLSFRSFFTIGAYEENAEFKGLLESISKYGLLIAGSLGAVSLLFFLISHIFFLGEEIVWMYSETGADKEIMLWDKVLIFILCMGCIYLSRSSISLNWNRFLLAFFVWFICLAMLLDDIAARDILFVTDYLVFVLIIAVGTMPFKGWHISLLATSVILTANTTITISNDLFGLSAVNTKQSQLVYLFLITIVLTGLTSLIYLSRFEQFKARNRAEELKEALKQRAETLEILKEKSEQQAEQLLENEKLKDRFFANISHEFRTPLTVILGPLKDLLHLDSEEKTRKIGTETLQLMYRNGQHLLELINQLLDLFKIDSGNIHLNKQKVDLSTYLPETVRSFVPLAESQHVMLTCSVPEYPLNARVDPQQMERVIGNLVSNAIKFTPQGGQVNVLIDQQKDFIRIRIEDTGIGIPEYDIPHIFDRFYQGSHSNHSQHPGTGIGLALAREIVELHGGDINVKTRPGEGSEFIIRLYEISEQSGSRIYSDGVHYQQGDEHVLVSEDVDPWEENDGLIEIEEDTATVLLVDDNPDILSYLCPRLSRRYNVIAKDRSSEVIEIIKNNLVDLVISDVMMPEPDGFELCRIIKEDPELNHIPVILLTALAAEENRIEGLEIGADDYISKPFSASELLIRVENLIELRQTLRNKYSEQIHLKGKEVEVTSEDARFLKQVQAVIEKHMDDSNFSVDWLAGEVNLSSRQLQRKIRSVTNLSAGGYIRMMRLERAAQLLSQQWGNISEVAYKVGFQDAKYFSRLFKQTFDVTPTEYAGKQV